MRSALTAAIVAAVVASGSAVAATKLIDGRSIRDDTISASKLTRAAIASLHGMRGPRGPQGRRGTDGTSITFTLVRGPNVNVPPGTDAGTSSALCPGGSYPVGGGFIVTNGFDASPVVIASAPDTSDGNTADGWDAQMGNSSQAGATMPLTFHAWATCETGGGTITIPGS